MCTILELHRQSCFQQSITNTHWDFTVFHFGINQVIISIYEMETLVPSNGVFSFLTVPGLCGFAVEGVDVSTPSSFFTSDPSTVPVGGLAPETISY